MSLSLSYPLLLLFYSPVFKKLQVSAYSLSLPLSLSPSLFLLSLFLPLSLSLSLASLPLSLSFPGVTCGGADDSPAELSLCLQWEGPMPAQVRGCRVACRDDCTLSSWSSFTPCQGCGGWRSRSRTLIGNTHTLTTHSQTHTHITHKHPTLPHTHTHTHTHIPYLHSHFYTHTHKYTQMPTSNPIGWRCITAHRVIF